MPRKVVLFTDLPESSSIKVALDRLSYYGHLHVLPCIRSERGSIRAALAGACGLLCRPNDGIEFMPSDLELALSPFIVGTFSSGIDHLKGINGLPGVSIERSHGGNAAGVADLAINSAITLTRRSAIAQQSMQHGVFEAPAGTRVERKHWMLIGAGEQASHVIAKCAGFGIDRFTVYHDQMTDQKLHNCIRKVPPELLISRSPLQFQFKSTVGQTTTVAGTGDLFGTIPQADIISLHVPAKLPDPVTGRPGTEGMVNSQFLALMKDPSFLINVSRGSLVNERAIIDWLQSHPDCGYAADVVDPRAERQKDPTLSTLHQEYIRNSHNSDPRSLLNLILTPHIGGSAIEDFDSVCSEVLIRVLQALNIAVPEPLGRSL